jgi:hypothetical protein
MKRDPKCCVKVENLVVGKEYYYFEMENENPLSAKYVEMCERDTYTFEIDGSLYLPFSKSGVEKFIEEI